MLSNPRALADNAYFAVYSLFSLIVLSTPLWQFEAGNGPHSESCRGLCGGRGA